MTHPLSEPTTPPAFAVIVYEDGVCEINAAPWMDRGSVANAMITLATQMLDELVAEDGRS